VRAAVALALAAVLVAAACSSLAVTHRGSGATGATELTVFGAASLKGVLAKAKGAYEAAHPEVRLTISIDSSAALETQIEQGAPADIFLSADTANPGKLLDKGFADGSARAFATNLLIVIVPAGNPAAIKSPLDLARPGIKIVAAGQAVPISKYAAQLIANLARQPGYPADFAARYRSNVVSHEDNVGGVVAKVELGEADAGIVYRTDASASTKVATVAIPPEATVPATYAGVVLKASPHRPAAGAFLDWLVGADGQALLGTLGFLPPTS
jgi:molybdate transport system substrate-binding protein